MQAAEEILKGVPPRDTIYFRKVTGYSKGTGTVWAGHPEHEILADIERFRELIHYMVEKGYDPESLITIRIIDSGYCYLVDGHHRTSILLTFPDKVYEEFLPCRIVGRSPGWQKVLDIAKDMYIRGDERLYTAIDHPEFDGWEAASDPVLRAAAITRALPFNARIIDIGCNHGGVAVELARRGHTVLGLEYNRKYIALAQALQNTILGHCGVTFQREDAWKFLEASRFDKPDYILCLSVLHHEAKAGGPDRVGELLRLAAGKSKQGVIVEMASGEESQMQGKDVPDTQAGYREWLEKCSGLPVELLCEGVPESAYDTDRRRWLWIVRPATAKLR